MKASRAVISRQILPGSGTEKMQVQAERFRISCCAVSQNKISARPAVSQPE